MINELLNEATCIATLTCAGFKKMLLKPSNFLLQWILFSSIHSKLYGQNADERSNYTWSLSCKWKKKKKTICSRTDKTSNRWHWLKWWWNCSHARKFIAQEVWFSKKNKVRKQKIVCTIIEIKYPLEFFWIYANQNSRYFCSSFGLSSNLMKIYWSYWETKV